MDVITFPKNLKTTSSVSILLHGVISLPDATSYDKEIFKHLLLEKYWPKAVLVGKLE